VRGFHNGADRFVKKFTHIEIHTRDKFRVRFVPGVNFDIELPPRGNHARQFSTSPVAKRFHTSRPGVVVEISLDQ
jgi:hypothetical protein